MRWMRASSGRCRSRARTRLKARPSACAPPSGGGLSRAYAAKRSAKAVLSPRASAGQALATARARLSASAADVIATIRASRPFAGGPAYSARMSSAWRTASRARGSAITGRVAPARATVHSRPDRLKLSCDLPVRREVVIAFEENTRWRRPRAQLFEQLNNARDNCMGVGVVVDAIPLHPPGHMHIGDPLKRHAIQERERVVAVVAR